MKTCNTCSQTREEACFHKRASSRDGLQHKCKDCQKKWLDEHRDAQRKAWRKFRKSNHFRLRYGISNEDYAAMVEAQAGRCLICREVPEDPLRVDHCHSSGVVRGLLCDPCNRGLAQFDELLDALAEAVRYVS